MRWLIITKNAFDYLENEYGYEGSCSEAEDIAWDLAYEDFFSSYGIDDIVRDQYPEGVPEENEDDVYYECEDLVYEYISAFVEEFEGTDEEWSNLKKV